MALKKPLVCHIKHMYHYIYMEVSMIIHHSLKILEQLSEIESLIKKIEKYIEQNEIEVDRDKILEAIMASRKMKRN